MQRVVQRHMRLAAAALAGAVRLDRAGAAASGCPLRHLRRAAQGLRAEFAWAVRIDVGTRRMLGTDRKAEP